jgi:hypothetical protein
MRRSKPGICMKALMKWNLRMRNPRKTLNRKNFYGKAGSGKNPCGNVENRKILYGKVENEKTLCWKAENGTNLHGKTENGKRRYIGT